MSVPVPAAMPALAADLRKRIADNHDLLRPEGLHAGQSDFDIGVALDGVLDEAVELPVMEGVPPAEDFGLRQVILGNDGLPGGSVRNRDRDFREMIVGPDGASAQRRDCAGDQEPAFCHQLHVPPHPWRRQGI